MLKNPWLRHFGITLLILGFVRVPLPASPDPHSRNQIARRDAGPLAAATALDTAADSADDGSSRSPLSLPFDLLSLVTCSCPAESEESTEDCGGDGETSDPLGKSVLSEESLLRFGGMRSFARRLLAWVDFVDIKTDRHAPSRVLNTPSGVARNGTSPSFGASFNALFQRWSC